MAEDSSQILKKYKELLQKSPTAYSPGVTPTQSDISLQRKVIGLEKSEGVAEAQRLKEQWYTELTPGDKPKDEQGLIGKALHLLMTPGYAVTGAIETALGKGTEKGLVKNIKANLKEGGTMGDLIRSYGVNNYVAMPLGLALDIALDPLAWATLGTSAIVPRTAIGAMKASKAGGSALKGAKLGAESSLLGKAAWTGKAAAYTGKKFGITGETKGLSKFADLQKSISERATKTSGQYDKLTGEGIESIVKHSQRDRFMDKVSRKLDETELGRGLKHVLEYSNKKQIAATKETDKLATLAAKETSEAVGKSIKETGDVLYKGTKVSGKNIRPAEIVSDLRAEKKAADKISEQVQKEIENIKTLLEKDSVALERFTGMSKKEAKEIAELVSHYKIGVDKYDKSVAKVLMGTKARKFFDSYAVYSGWFKNMKIGFNPATRMNALIGNLAMASMAGIDIASPGMMRSTKNAIEMVTKKNSKFLKPFMESDGFIEAIKKYPTVWENVTGIRADIVLKGRAHIDGMVDTMMKSGNFKSADVNAVKKAFEEVSETFTREYNVAEGLRSTVRTTAGAPEGTFFSAEFMTGPYTKFLEKLRLSKNPAANFVYKASTVSMESYNKIDQTNRVALVLNLGVEGVSRKELKLLSNRFVFGMKDVVKAGEKFKLSPDKSLEIAQAVYMNYAAMPPFVKAMRTLPLVGHPFISFAYGMTGIAAETAMYNPMFYNKISYLLHEISGEKSPLEKQALESGYYQWLQKPGMTKVPFFEENPIYLNTANMIPHYTMNLLQPPERDYESRYGRAIASLIDKTPFFKTPDGQVMLDYVIMPTILQGERPQGMFGQPLWEKDASLLGKAGYATRSLAESVLPPALGYAGLGVKAGIPSEESLQYMPHYRLRQLGYATQGKSSIGIEGTEPAAEKTARVLAAMAGIPYYPVKLQHSEPKKK